MQNEDQTDVMQDAGRNQFAGRPTEYLVEELRKLGRRTLDATTFEFVEAAADRLEALYYGTTRAEPAEELDKARAKIRIYRKQLREHQRALRTWRRVSEISTDRSVAQGQTIHELRKQLAAATSPLPNAVTDL